MVAITYYFLQGIDVLTSTLFRNMEKIDKVKEAKLILFCWGEDNNDCNAINTLKQKGVDGIIYDRLVDKIFRKKGFMISSEKRH